MNKSVKKALILGGIGFIVGLLIGLTVSFLTNEAPLDGFAFDSYLCFELLIGGIYGAMAMGGSVVYDIESFSIARSTAIHFFITFVGFHLLAYVQGWLRPEETWYILLTIAWLIAYFIIWLVQYLIFRHKVKQLNEDLSRIRH